MRTSLSLLAALAGCLLLCLTLPGPAHAQRAIVLVRHAEKLDESPTAVLSPAGHARAGRLAELLAAFGVRAIFATEYQRTQQTAQPLAQKTGLSTTIVAASARAELLQKLRALQREDAALVVGHSDTLPLLIKELGVTEPVAIAAGDYANIFVVVPRGPAAPALLRLRF